jgi:hypothetical protein
VTVVDPERVMVRRALPYGPPAILLALLVGAAVGGWHVGWSAALGVAIVVANFVTSGLSISWAARISLTAIAAVVMGGFLLRMAAFVAIMWALDQYTSWFVPVAFGLAVVPATILLLTYELRLLQGGLASELIIPADQRTSP